EITPVPRLGDLEDEQKQNAQLALQQAQAAADLAQTKAKQAKEPPPEPTVPPALQTQQLQKAQQPVAQKKTDEPVQKQESVADTPEPAKLWIMPGMDLKLQQLADEGVVSVTWHDHLSSCDQCESNNGQTRKLGETFPSGHQMIP